MSEQVDLAQLVSRVQGEFRSLRERAAMTDATRKLGDLATSITGLPGDIEKLRERGYVFAGYLGARTETIKAQWADIRSQIEAQVQIETDRLRQAVSKVDPYLTRLATPGGREDAVRQLVAQVQGLLPNLESEIKQAEERISGLYGSLDKELNEIRQKLSKFNWYMDMMDEAGFQLGATESIYIVAKAEWVKSGKGKDDPDGILYLTDQRLIFERKEKEGGFLGFGGKKVQGIEWEVALGAISKVTSEKKGLFGGKDMVTFEFSSGGPGSPTTLEVKGGVNATWYAQQVERAKGGEIDQERAVQIAPDVLERVKSAPAACPSCGAPFTTPITRTTSQIACEYCGEVVRL